MKSILRAVLIVGLAIFAAALLFARPALPQDQAYHQFADQRTLLGIPHCLNVLSNIPFCIVGLLGVYCIAAGRATIQTPAERWLFLLLFIGIGLTGLGSSYYHLDPDSARLVWDRLPMALAFMSLFSAIIAERISVRLGLALLGPLALAGIASVLYWHAYDDLRPYYLVQFYPIMAIPLILLVFPPRYTGTSYYFLALACYVGAKFVEHPYDGTIFAAGHVVSGHTLKHLLAALGAYFILEMLRQRRSLSPRDR